MCHFGICQLSGLTFNTLRPRQNGRYFADDIFKCISLDENVWISLKMSLKFVPKVRINNIPALVLIMAWRRSDDEPLSWLSEPMMVSLLTHIYVVRPQWVNSWSCFSEDKVCPKSMSFKSNGNQLVKPPCSYDKAWRGYKGDWIKSFGCWDPLCFTVQA